MSLDIKAVSTSITRALSYGHSLTENCLETVLHTNSRQPSLLYDHPLNVLTTCLQITEFTTSDSYQKTKSLYLLQNKKLQFSFKIM